MDYDIDQIIKELYEENISVVFPVDEPLTGKTRLAITCHVCNSSYTRCLEFFRRSLRCPICIRKNKKDIRKENRRQQYEREKERVTKRVHPGSKCLSKITGNTHQKISMECSFGHQWKTKAMMLFGDIETKTWCPVCKRPNKKDKIIKGQAKKDKSLERLESTAKSKGFILLSSEWFNRRDWKYTFKCSVCGKIIKSTADKMIMRNQLCSADCYWYSKEKDIPEIENKKSKAFRNLLKACEFIDVEFVRINSETGYYRNHKQTATFRCHCGEKFESRIEAFLMFCKLKRSSRDSIKKCKGCGSPFITRGKEAFSISKKKKEPKSELFVVSPKKPLNIKKEIY